MDEEFQVTIRLQVDDNTTQPLRAAEQRLAQFGQTVKTAQSALQTLTRTPAQLQLTLLDRVTAPLRSVQQTLTKLVQSPYEVAVSVVQKGKDLLGGLGGRIGGALGGLAGNVGGALGSIAGVFLNPITAALGLGAGVAGLAGFAKAAFEAAARVGELDVTLQALAKANDLSYDAMQDQVKALRRTGIEYASAQQVVALFAQNQLDLSQATKLARVAQDAAVVSGQNSTDTLNQLVHGITTQNSLVLRNAGLNVQAGAAMDAYAKALGKSSTELTEAERAQAVMNAVIEAGATVAGAYEAAMTEPGKVLRSFPRLFDDIRVSIGQVLVTAFGPLILSAYDMTKAFAASLQEGGSLYPMLLRMGEAAAGAVEGVRWLGDVFGRIAQAWSDFTDLLAELGALDDLRAALEYLSEAGAVLNEAFAILFPTTDEVTDSASKAFSPLDALAYVIKAVAKAAELMSRFILFVAEGVRGLAALVKTLTDGFKGLLDQLQPVFDLLSKIGGLLEKISPAGIGAAVGGLVGGAKVGGPGGIGEIAGSLASALGPSAAQAASSAISTGMNYLGSQAFVNYCLKFVDDMFGTSNRLGTAWLAAQQRATTVGGSLQDVPAGMATYLRADPSNQGAGHVMISLGGGRFLDPSYKGVRITQVGDELWDYYTGLYYGYGPGGNLNAQTMAMQAGGILTEPVMGVGLRTGSPYTFGEAGAEAVVPLGSGRAGGGQTVTIGSITISGVDGGPTELREAVVAGVLDALAQTYEQIAPNVR